MIFGSPLHPAFPIVSAAWLAVQLAAVGLIWWFVGRRRRGRERTVAAWFLAGGALFAVGLAVFLAISGYRSVPVALRVGPDAVVIVTRSGDREIPLRHISSVMVDDAGAYGFGYSPYFYVNNGGWRYNSPFGVVADYWVSGLGKTRVYVTDHTRAVVILARRPTIVSPSDPAAFARAIGHSLRLSRTQ